MGHSHHQGHLAILLASYSINKARDRCMRSSDPPEAILGSGRLAALTHHQGLGTPTAAGPCMHKARHCTALHYITPHRTALHCTSLHYATPHRTPQDRTAPHTPHCTLRHPKLSLRYTTLHYHTVYCTTLECTSAMLRCTTRWYAVLMLHTANKMLYGA